MRASFTVEATFVMSIVLFIIVFIIYLSFYLHDYCKIKGYIDSVLHKATLNLKHEADIITGKVNYDEISKGIVSKIMGRDDSKEGEVEYHLNRLLSNGLLATKVDKINVSRGIFNITIRVEGMFYAPIKGIQRIISGDKAIIVETKAVYHYPADTVRFSEVILDTGSKIKGFDKLKEVIEKLLPN